jgi:uncharacterized protein
MGDGTAITARLGKGVADENASQWNALTQSNPFVSHAFLAACEQSGSATPRTGWRPVPIVIESPTGGITGALPAYLKSHSQGEYIFDHNWADAWMNSGRDYYPKLQIASPFSPVPGPRILAQDEATALALLAAAEQVTVNNDLSSAHATFVRDEQLPLFKARDWLIRVGVQYHWEDDGYGDFDGFLGALAARKRKTIKKERATAQAGLTIKTLRGAEITHDYWDAFWLFYQDTGARKYGRPYLTRAFFDEVAVTMADQLLLFVAERDGVPIAGALNFIAPDTLYGRYWGCSEDVPCLHFELCYYQAIDWALANGLSRVEAGAQGQHKIARGYRPSRTWSAHFIPDLGFRRAIADFLTRETRAIEYEIAALDEMGPFKKADGRERENR